MCNKIAATVESTPPDKPKITLSLPSLVCKSLIVSSTNESGVQSQLQLQIETIKLESDLIFTRDISHWWHAFRLRNIVLSTGCRDYQQNISFTRHYRQLFDSNNLPDIYTGLMYFRYTQEATNFFSLAEQIFRNWDYISKSVLLNCYDNQPTTDVVYSLTTKILGEEHCTIPSMDWINFVHMKPKVNNWPDTPWHKLVMCETDIPMIRINNVNQ